MQSSQIPFYFPQTAPQQEVKGPKPIQIEEFLELLLFLCLGIYMVCHMLFIPLEVLAFGFLLDLHFAPVLYFFGGLLAGKYITILLMFYGAFHHLALWKKHHYIELTLFGLACLLVSAVQTYFIIAIDEGFRRAGFAPIREHPFLWDFVGYVVCGMQGFIYFIYMACTQPPAMDSQEYVKYINIPQMESLQSTQMQFEGQPMLVQPQPPEELMQMQELPVMLPKVETVQKVFKPAPKQPQRAAMKVPIYFVPNA